MSAKPSKPKMTRAMVGLMRDSQCSLVLVGGLTVGLSPPVYTWHIRSSYETQAVRKGAETMQKLAASARKVWDLEKRVAELEAQLKLA